MNGQAIYRISLAMSDVLVGIIVFPTFVCTNLFQQHTDIVNYLDQSTPYLNAVGFFTMLSLHVSMFSLAAAATDRFKAIHNPLTFNIQSSISIARKTCIGIWIISIILAAIPLGFLDKSLRYGVIFGTIVIPLYYDPTYLSNPFLIYASFVFLIPVVTMWIFTIMTFLYYKKHNRNRRQIVSSQLQELHLKRQTRLMLTLSIMVGVFSVCVLPAVVAFITVFQVENVVDYFRSFNPSTSVIVMIILTSNSVWNFFIYSTRDRAFRKSAKNKLRNLQLKFLN